MPTIVEFGGGGGSGSKNLVYTYEYNKPIELDKSGILAILGSNYGDHHVYLQGSTDGTSYTNLVDHTGANNAVAIRDYIYDDWSPYKYFKLNANGSARFGVIIKGGYDVKYTFCSGYNRGTSNVIEGGKNGIKVICGANYSDHRIAIDGSSDGVNFVTIFNNNVNVAFNSITPKEYSFNSYKYYRARMTAGSAAFAILLPY